MTAAVGARITSFGRFDATGAESDFIPKG